MFWYRQGSFKAEILTTGSPRCPHASGASKKIAKQAFLTNFRKNFRENFRDRQKKTFAIAASGVVATAWYKEQQDETAFRMLPLSFWPNS